MLTLWGGVVLWQSDQSWRYRGTPHSVNIDIDNGVNAFAFKERTKESCDRAINPDAIDNGVYAFAFASRYVSGPAGKVVRGAQSILLLYPRITGNQPWVPNKQQTAFNWTTEIHLLLTVCSHGGVILACSIVVKGQTKDGACSALRAWREHSVVAPRCHHCSWLAHPGHLRLRPFPVP